jgi:TPR repeat protein
MSFRWVPILAVAAIASFPIAAQASPPDSGALCDQQAGNTDDPDLPGMQGVKGVIWDLIGSGAEAACRRAVADHPSERRYVFQLGRALDKKDDFAGALAQYQRAIDAGSAIAMNSVGLLYQYGDGVPEDAPKAVTFYQRAADAGVLIALGNIAYLYLDGAIPGKGAADAVALYQKEIAAGEGWGAYDLGNVYQAGNGVPVDNTRAAQLFRMAMASPNPQVAAGGANALAWLTTITRGDLVEAERLVNLALAKERTEDVWSKGDYYDTRALIYHRTGRDILALPDIQEAIKYRPELAAYHDRLGDVYVALGRKADAIAAWQKALTLEEPEPVDEPDFSVDGIRKKIADAQKP